MNMQMTNIVHGNIDDYHIHWSTLSSVLLDFGCYLPRIHIYSHFLLVFKRWCYVYLFFCLDFIAKFSLDIKFIMLGKNFDILRVSG